MHPAFGGFINDPTAQMGFQLGKSAVDAGQQYMEQNVSTTGQKVASAKESTDITLDSSTAT